MDIKYRAVIVGFGGQDGTLLAKSLGEQGYEIIGVTRDSLVLKGKKLQTFSVGRVDEVKKFIQDYPPTEIYYLAAHHTSAEKDTGSYQPESYHQFHEVHVEGLLNFLSAIYDHAPACRLFYAASSLIFNGSIGPKQNEETPYSPVGFYGLTKLQGMYLCKHFRENYGIHASSGILYSHESALRKPWFLSKKLIVAAHEIGCGEREYLGIGSLQAENDWGYAPDYVEAFQLIAKLDTPQDFIVATGETHSVQEFAQIVFSCFGLDAKQHLVEDNALLGRVSPRKMGDFTKLNRATGWKPRQSFQAMVEKLVDNYLELYSESATR